MAADDPLARGIALLFPTALMLPAWSSGRSFDGGSGNARFIVPQNKVKPYVRVAKQTISKTDKLKKQERAR